MDILKVLESGQSKKQTLAIVRYIGDETAKFKILKNILFSNNFQLAQRASWPLSYSAIQHPALIQPYFTKLIHLLKQDIVHTSVKRHILNIFREIEIPEKYQSQLLVVCFDMIVKLDQPPAVTANAITVASNICNNYPELKNELRLQLNHLSQFPQPPSISSRLKLAQKKLRN
jgi:hypothetical protein